MRIDVHTHVWPDRIAGVVLQSMVGELEPNSDPTTALGGGSIKIQKGE